MSACCSTYISYCEYTVTTPRTHDEHTRRARDHDEHTEHTTSSRRAHFKHEHTTSTGRAHHEHKMITSTRRAHDEHTTSTRRAHDRAHGEYELKKYVYKNITANGMVTHVLTYTCMAHTRTRTGGVRVGANHHDRANSTSAKASR